MKKIFLAMLFLFFTFCVNAQGQKTIQAPGDFEFNTSYNFGNVAKHTQSYPGLYFISLLDGDNVYQT